MKRKEKNTSARSAVPEMTGPSPREQASRDVLYLAGCAVNGTLPDPQRIAGMDLQAVYDVACTHLLAAVASHALEAAGVQDPRFIQAKAMAIRKMALMDMEMAAVLARFEEAGIWYLPMKGALLKDLYPAYGIREMADRDILVDPDRADEVRGIMEDLGFTTTMFDRKYHDCYEKLPVSNFEIHRSIIGPYAGETMVRYYENVKDRLLKDEGNKYGRHFTPEDFYVFLVAHEYKHYSTAGTGLRSLLDVYVCLQKMKPDLKYVTAECEKLGVAEFERNGRELVLALFGGGEMTSAGRGMLAFMTSSGVYGSEEKRAENTLNEKGRLGYFLSRLTLPWYGMTELYPVLKKAPVLYPFCWTHRLVYAAIHKRQKVLYQLKAGLRRK